MMAFQMLDSFQLKVDEIIDAYKDNPATGNTCSTLATHFCTLFSKAKSCFIEGEGVKRAQAYQNTIMSLVEFSEKRGNVENSDLLAIKLFLDLDGCFQHKPSELGGSSRLAGLLLNGLLFNLSISETQIEDKFKKLQQQYKDAASDTVSRLMQIAADNKPTIATAKLLLIKEHLQRELGREKIQELVKILKEFALEQQKQDATKKARFNGYSYPSPASSRK